MIIEGQEGESCRYSSTCGSEHRRGFIKSSGTDTAEDDGGGLVDLVGNQRSLS